MENNNINICSYNCNGLGDHLKRKDVFDFVRSRKFDICLLQETHLLTSQENFIRSCWGGEVVVAGNSTNSNGVIILFSNNFEYKIHKCVRGDNGNFIMLDIELENCRISLVNIYGPSAGDCPEFFDTIMEKLKEINNEKTILAGDWNCVLDEQIDCKNYVSQNRRPRTREKINEMITYFELNDIWRSSNKEKEQFTWRKFKTLKQARLDYFLISESLLTLIDDCKIEMKYKSDHSIISLAIKKKEFVRGKPYWKFNKSLLKDRNFIEIMKNVILKTKKEYCALVYKLDNIESVNDNELVLRISDQLFYEMLLMNMRGKCISYSSYVKKKNTEREKYLLENITLLEKEINNNKLEELETFKNELEDLRNKKIEGMNIRSRSTWIKEGEKGTKYFTNLEKRNYINKAMPTLINGEGENIYSQEEIANEVKTFYEQLYKKRDSLDNNLNESLPNDIPKLSQAQKDNIEGMITLEELKETLKNMKNDKSPGSDGFSVEFYKFFFQNIGVFLLRSINEGFTHGELSVTQKQGIITCIPKDNKDRRYLKNWRPISLLNISYKLASGVIANRLKLVLPEIINDCQKGFLKGRYIGENIRLIYDLMFYAENNNIPGLLLSIDYQKAFDSVSWKFIEKALRFFNFGNDIVRWFKTLYNNAKSSTYINGQYSPYFNIERGVRQGDPLSPYLYLIAAEVLSIMIRRNPEIKGISINTKEYLLSQFADDTALCLDGSEASFEAAIKTLDTFSSMSGLIINNEKTQILWFGSEKNSRKKYMRDRNFIWDPGTVRILGINFSSNLESMYEINYRNKLVEIESLLRIWSKRNLTPFGKITVLKTLAIPKLLYLFLNLPDPPKEFLVKIEKTLYTFLWNNKPSKIDKTTIKYEYAEGGIKMIDINLLLASLKISWLRRLLVNNSLLEMMHSFNPDIEKLFYNGGEIYETIEGHINLFWKDVAKHYRTLSNKCKSENMTEILSEYVFGNVHILRDNKPIICNQLSDQGVFRIGDLINNEHRLMTYREFLTEYQSININFLTYQGIVASIRSYLIKNGVRPWNENRQELTVQKPKIWIMIGKGNQAVKNILREEQSFNHISLNKWNLVFNNVQWTKIFTKIHRTTQDTKLKWFEYKILYRLVPTNRYLCQRNLKDTSICNLCNGAEQTIQHLFWSCDIVHTFWLRIQNEVHDSGNFRDQVFHEELVIFGKKEGIKTDKILDLIILAGKYYIFMCKTQDTLPMWNQFKPYMKRRLEIEKASQPTNKYYLYTDMLQRYQLLFN